MKRVLYFFLAVALASSLVGCGDSGGGYWPATGLTPTGSGKNVEPLGGGVDAQAVANSVFVPGVGAPQAFTDLSTGMNTGCSMLPGLPNFSSGYGLFAKILGASRSKKRSEATSSNVTVTSDPATSTDYAGYTKFVQSYTTTSYLPKSTSSSSSSSSSGSSGGSSYQPSCNIVLSTDSGSYESVSYTYSFEIYAKYIDTTGKAIVVSSDSDYWFKFPADQTVDQVYFFGTMKLTVSGSSYNWNSQTLFGSFTAPWIFKGVAAGPLLVSGTNTTTASGEYAGTDIPAVTSSFSISGTDSFFSFPAYTATSKYPTGTIKMGTSTLLVTFTFDGTNKVTVSYSGTAPSGAPTTITL